MRFNEAVTPIVLIALTAGVGAYAYFVDRAAISDADRLERRRDVFPTFRVEDVTRVELARPGDPLVLERQGDAHGTPSWTMTSPRQGAADPGAVDTLLRELELAARVRDVGDDVEAGLDAPRVRGKVTMGSVVMRFALGSDAPRPEGAAYMRVEGEGAFVVGRALRTQLLRGSDAYRPRALVPYGVSEMTRVVAKRADGGGFALERHGSTFRLDRDGARANRDAVDRLFSALAEATIDTFVDDAAADAALGSSASSVVISLRDPALPHLELRVGGECPGQPADVVAVRAAPRRVSACVARSLRDAIAIDDAALVDTSPFFAHADEIEEMRLEAPGTGVRVDLARRSTGWFERAPEEHELSPDESDSANALAAALASARASDVFGPKSSEATGREAPSSSRVTVIRTGGSVTEVVDVGLLGADGSTWAERRDDGAWLRLPNAVARRLQPHPVATRARALWHPPIDAADITAIDDGCGPAAQKLEWQSGAWTVRSRPSFAPDAVAVADLTSAMAHARASAWITEFDDGSFGLSGPDACRVTMTLGDDAQPRRATLVLGSATEGGFYARTVDDPAVFVAPAILRSLLAHPVVDRHRFRIDPGNVTGLSVLRAGVHLKIDLADGGTMKLVNALGGLVVYAASHVGHPAPAEGLTPPALEIDVTTRDDATANTETRLSFGAEVTVDAVDAYFARVAGVDATFVVRKPGVDAILADLSSDRAPSADGTPGSAEPSRPGALP